MKQAQLIKKSLVIGLVTIMLSITIFGVGCTETPTADINAITLAETRVPAVNLDIYIYINQNEPTKIPKSLIGVSEDISVASLAIWGTVYNETQYAIAMALTFPSVAEASTIFAQIPVTENSYKKLADRIIYVVNGLEEGPNSLKNAIDNDDFKKYDDKTALAEIARLPSAASALPGLIGIIKPNQAAVNILTQYLDDNTINTFATILNNTKARIITMGLFSTQPLDLADIVQKATDNALRETDLGIAITLDSAYPGFVFSPIAGAIIRSLGLAEVKVGELTTYKNEVNVGDNKTIPLYINISGNHMYLAISGKESYAQQILTDIKR